MPLHPITKYRRPEKSLRAHTAQPHKGRESLSSPCPGTHPAVRQPCPSRAAVTSLTSQPQAQPLLSGAKKTISYHLGSRERSQAVRTRKKRQLAGGQHGPWHWHCGSNRSWAFSLPCLSVRLCPQRSPNSQQRLPQTPPSHTHPHLLPGACSVSRSCGSSLSLNFSSGLGNFP